jgi:hypothetical protein
MSDRDIQCDKCPSQKSLKFYYTQTSVDKDGKSSISQRYLCPTHMAELDRGIRATMRGIKPAALRLGMQRALKA